MPPTRAAAVLPFLVALLLPAPTAGADVDLLVNRNFGDDPGSPFNGWVASGDGLLIHDLTAGHPLPPAARIEAENGEWVALRQCVGVLAGGEYHLEAYSFTYLGGGDSEVSVTFFAARDCIGPPLATSIADQVSFPSWSLRQRSGVIAPVDARSARVEIYVESFPLDEMWIAFDAVAFVPEPGGAAGAAVAVAVLAALARCGRLRSVSRPRRRAGADTVS